MPNFLPETVSISLDVGTRLAVFGANESGISQFRVVGEDRYEFFNAGVARQLKQLPTKNFAFALVNGKLPTEVLDTIETACDRSGVRSILVTEGGGPLIDTMKGWPKGASKGVVNLEVLKVVKRIDLKEALPGANHNPPPKPPTPPPPPPNPDPAPPPPTKSLEEVLKGLESYYDQYGGDHKRVIAHIRSLGVTEAMISNGALYQRILTIRKRREKQAKGQNNGACAELLASDLGQRLLAAVEASTAANRQAVELAAQVAEENSALRQSVRALQEQVESLAGLATENQRLSKQLKPFLEAAAAAAVVK